MPATPRAAAIPDGTACGNRSCMAAAAGAMSAMHHRHLHTHADDDLLLETIAEPMRRIDPRAERGAPVLVADLWRAVDRLFPGKDAFDAALVRLERSNRLALVRHDAAMFAGEGDDTVLVFDGRMHYCGVALR